MDSEKTPNTGQKTQSFESVMGKYKGIYQQMQAMVDGTRRVRGVGK